jgi:hypothetical protein
VRRGADSRSDAAPGIPFDCGKGDPFLSDQFPRDLPAPPGFHELMRQLDDLAAHVIKHHALTPAATREEWEMLRAAKQLLRLVRVSEKVFPEPQPIDGAGSEI